MSSAEHTSFQVLVPSFPARASLLLGRRGVMPPFCCSGGQSKLLFVHTGTTGQSSNGSRIIQELRHRSTTEASAGSGAAKRILFCTSVVAEAPGSVLASVFTGAPFITGASVAAYLF